MGRGIGQPFDIPVPFFLIAHPKGNVLFDTGNALAVAHDKVKHWGANVMASYDPIMDKDDYDVFGDGKLQIVFTPGHSPGHQSLLVNLKKWGTTLLTGDSVYTEEILKEDVLPGLVHSPTDAVQSIRRTRDLQQLKGVRIITGHDPAAWAKFKLAPAYYE